MMALFRDNIVALDLDSGEISEFARLPTGIASHTGAIIGDYLFMYGGTNGLKFFDAVTRYDIKNKKWTLMTKYPDSQKKSRFFQDGRLGTSSALSEGDDGVWVLFGGSSATDDYGDFLVLRKQHLLDDANFSEITEIF